MLRPRRHVENEEEPPERVFVDLTKTLPSELLCEIFHLLVAADPARFSDAPKNSPERAMRRSTRINPTVPSSWRIRGWFVVAHVCTRWRTLALDQAALWTTIDMNLGPSWVETFITRSRPLPFLLVNELVESASAIHSKSRANARIGILNSTSRNHSQRIIKLDISEPCFFVDVLRARLGASPPDFLKSYPILETLIINGDTMGLYPHSWTLFNAPKLRKLALYGIQLFPWTAAAFSRLTHLVVTNQIGFDLDWSNLRSFLIDIPELKAMYLNGILPVGVTNSQWRIAFPQLCRLGLRSPANRVKAFLDLVDAPSFLETDICACLRNPDNINTAFSDVMSSTLGHTLPASLTDLTLIRIPSDPLANLGAYISLRACQHEDDVGPIHLSREEHFAASGNTEALVRHYEPAELGSHILNADDGTHTAGHHILEIFAKQRPVGQGTPDPVSLPFPNVQTLRIGGKWSTHALLESFSSMTGVTHLSLYDDSCFAALVTAPAATLFPQLESLSFAYADTSRVYVWVSPRIAYCTTTYQRVEGPSPCTELENLVRARAEAGMPMRHLYFYEAHLFISAFQEHALETEVDYSHVIDLVQEDEGLRIWFDRDKGGYKSNDPRWS